MGLSPSDGGEGGRSWSRAAKATSRVQVERPVTCGCGPWGQAQTAGARQSPGGGGWGGGACRDSGLRDARAVERSWPGQGSRGPTQRVHTQATNQPPTTPLQRPLLRKLNTSKEKRCFLQERLPIYGKGGKNTQIMPGAVHRRIAGTPGEAEGLPNTPESTPCSYSEIRPSSGSYLNGAQAAFSLF